MTKYTVRILAALLALMMCASALVACGGGEEETTGRINLPTGEGTGDGTDEGTGEGTDDGTRETADLSGITDPELPLPTIAALQVAASSGVTLSTVSAPSAADCNVIAKLPADVAKGALVLVNPANALKYDPENVLVDLYSHRGKVEGASAYKLKDNSLKLTEEALDAFNAWTIAAYASTSGYVLVSDAYRTYADQEDIFNAALQTYGADKVLEYAMKPDNSDYRAGYSVYLKYMPADGKTYAMSDAVAQNALAALNASASKYGFINRYPADKESVTGIKHSVVPFQYRYVGAAHATVINAGGYALEDYIAGVKNYTSDNRLKIETADHTYHVFYVPAVADNATNILIPKTAVDYSISGNNIDGFVVSVTVR